MKLSTLVKSACLSALPCIALASESPNVLLLIADDMGVDASSCYQLGAQQANMPNIQRLCEQGMVYENAYSAPVCSPTRATIMTGKYGFRTGMGAAIPRDGEHGLSVTETSLFKQLEKSTYSANLLGKWHLAGSQDGLDQPQKLSVPDYYGMYKGGVRDYFKWPAVTNGERVKVSTYATTELTNKAISWIEKQNKPWFLWLAYNAPHSPFHLPPQNLHSAGQLPSDAQTIKQNPLPYYNAMLEALDTEIGRLFASMDAKTKANTIIMFIGDNGSPNQVTRGFYGDHAAKGTIYDAGTHVPFVVAGPNIKAGRSDSFVMTSDLYTTVASLAGVKATTPDAFDFSPTLYGQKGARDYIYVEHFQADKSGAKPKDVFGWAVREGNFKLLQEDGKSPALYDLAADPKELNNLLSDGTSKQEAQTIAQLQQRYEQIHR